MLRFYKYQATGNDFVMMDNRGQNLAFDKQEIAYICDRNFGVGSDGLILIQDHHECDFEMAFFNPDGSQSFCGNGSRAAVLFARHLGIIDRKARFVAIDGEHTATVTDSQVEVRMNPATGYKKIESDFYLHTGSPHYIRMTAKANEQDLAAIAVPIRNHKDFSPGGTNVNLVEEIKKGTILVRTYERGVENETLSCGTGVTACALVYGKTQNKMTVNVVTKGGKLTVKFKLDSKNNFKDIYLCGPASRVFEGNINL